jgi:hypothetical protein
VLRRPIESTAVIGKVDRRPIASRPLRAMNLSSLSGGAAREGLRTLACGAAGYEFVG